MTLRVRSLRHAAAGLVLCASLAACAGLRGPTAAPIVTSPTSPTSVSQTQSPTTIAMSPDDQVTYDRLRDSDLQGVIDVDKPAVHEAVRGDIVVVGPVAQAVVDEVADSVASLAPDVADFAGVQIIEPALVVVPADDQDFLRWSGGGLPDALGVTFTKDNRRASWTLLRPGVDAADPTEVDIIVAHELFHQLTGLNPDVPGWLAEGFAEFAAAELVGEFDRTMPKRAHLPTDEEITGSDPRTADAAYYLSAKFAAYLSDTYGDDAMTFYRDAVDHGVDAVIQDDLGVTLSEAVAQWQASYRPTAVVS